jgi:5-methylcytosine-specific restriction endonuclease McrA
MNRQCRASHYLRTRLSEAGFAVRYQPYTLRHPLEMYDENFDPPLVIGEVVKGSKPQDEDYAGIIRRYPRKKYFNKTETLQIWEQSGRRCHLCTKEWTLEQKGAEGWHIDHVIPHTSGGSKVEEMPNFRVACARCNLSKGKGWTERTMKEAISELAEKFDSGSTYKTHKVKK